ncbi:MAG TPA: DUF2332 domain-containing protein [Solirubrobacteraceae bacterium]|nr:DUF2332 domain-containing protein [Solirubrobacteraceae bacterium]
MRSELAAGDPREQIAAGFRRFAREAAGRSPLYVETAELVADSPWVLDFLAAMPEAKWQPNVLLAVVRYLFGTPGSGREFVALVQQRADEIAETMTVRSTQTNEPARCATLLPVLARLPQPLALLEVGASAGLCLLPDYYAYDYGGGHEVGPTASCGVEAPRFACRASAGTPLPVLGVEVAWRAGLDLNPVDLRDDAEVRWLEALVWPGEEYRLPRLRAACEVARGVSPRVVRGDLRVDLPALAAEAPAHATLVVFHTAVLAYVRDPGDREAFARSVASCGAVWIANEGAHNIPGVAAPTDGHPDPAAFLLCVDAESVAWTDGHGTWIDWLSASAS